MIHGTVNHYRSFDTECLKENVNALAFLILCLPCLAPPISRAPNYGGLLRQVIDANGNMLTHLPQGLGKLRLRSLKISYNRLETLRHDVFLPTLKGTLRQLWLSNNNLLQLPDSLVEVNSENQKGSALQFR